MSIDRFLKEIGLEEYIDVFRDEAVELETLRDLRDEDLRLLKMPLGHRKKLLRAAAAFAHVENTHTDEKPENRRVTVLFSDLVDSTRLAQKMSTEDLRDLLASFHMASAQAIERQGGHVAKYLGDGLMAYFGYPNAHEDDALRAVEAALALRHAARSIPLPEGDALQVRIGIHTGRVVAGEMGAGRTREKHSIVGEAPIVASRLEQLAEADEIYVSGAVRLLAEGFVNTEAIGEQKLKGIDHPLRVFRVLGRTNAKSRIEARSERGLTKIVGRGAEIALLQSRWQSVCEGEGQTILLSGEPGIGKSRLAAHLHDRLMQSNSTSVITQCSEQHSTSALYPFITLLETTAEVLDNDSKKTRLSKLSGHVDSLLGSEAAKSVEDYLSIEDTPMVSGQPTQKRRNFIAALLDWLCRPAKNGYACLIFEDAHWSDPSSLKLLTQLIARTRQLPILVVVTSRPGFDPEWVRQHNVTAISLNRLGRRASREIVREKLLREPSSRDRTEEIVIRAEGVPLFLEEFCRALRDGGERNGISTIPETLDESLSTRLDGLGQAKRLAQVGAMLGRRVPRDLLANVLDTDPADIEQNISKLVDAAIFAREDHGGKVEYMFTHALVQDAALASLLKREREKLHGKIADALIGLSGDSRFPAEAIARHLFEARRFDEAVHLWFHAGRLMQQRSADHEAIKHFREGLAALNMLPQSDERDRRELELVMALAPLILVVNGWSAKETYEIYAKARALCEKLRDRRGLLPVNYGEYLIHVSRAEYGSALALAQELLALAEELEDEAGLLQGHRVVAWCSLYLGRLAEADTHAQKLLAIYDLDRHQKVALDYGYDPRVAGLSILAIIFSLRGECAEAERLGVEAVAHARKIGHASSLAYALMFACAMSAAMRADAETAKHYGQHLKSLAEEQESELWAAYADVILGWSGKKGSDVVRAAIDRLSLTARNPWLPFFQSLCAELLMSEGEQSTAQDLLHDALSFVERSQERNWEPEICRLLAHTLPGKNAGLRATERGWLTRAIQAATRNGARALEQRARRDLSEVDDRLRSG